MGTIITGFVVFIIIVAAIKKIVKDMKNGKSFQCGGDCKNCNSHCNQ